MSVQVRELYDGRNAFLQADGSVGYRCCGGNSSIPVYLAGAISPSHAQAIRQSMIAKGINPDAPWCKGCSTVLEDFRDAIEEGGPAFVSMLATVASFIPGIGTAVAAVLSSALALAQGKDLSDAFIAGLKGALPGGAVTQAAFSAGQAALQGKSIEDIGISMLPIPEAAQKALTEGLKITVALANGEPVSDVMLQAGYNALPEWGQRGADLARALGDGRSFAEILVEQSQRTLPPFLQTGILAGAAVGHAQALRSRFTPDELSQLYQKVLDRPKSAVEIMAARELAYDMAQAQKTLYQYAAAKKNALLSTLDASTGIPANTSYVAKDLARAAMAQTVAPVGSKTASVDRTLAFMQGPSSSPPSSPVEAPFIFQGASASTLALMEQDVAQDVLRLSWIAYYKQKKAADPTVVKS
jgi:hypothetical protein